MSHRHLIQLDPQAQARWFALDRAGRIVSGPSDGLPQEAAQETLLLVPGEDVLLLEAPRVARQRRQLEQAMPFAIEDQLAVPVEHCHVCIVDVQDERVALAVVAHERMQEWLGVLAEQGLSADRMLSDLVLLPWQQGPVLLLDGEHALLRHARSGGFAGRREEVADWLQVLQQAGEARPLQVWARATELAQLPEAVQAWPGGIHTQTRDNPMQALLEGLEAAEGFDLLQGRHAPRQRTAGSKRLWRWAAALAGIGIVLGLVGMGLERWQLERRYTLERGRMESLLRMTLPEVQRVVDPRAQLTAEWNRRGGQANAGVLAMLARLGPILSGSGQYTLDGIEYREGVLDLTLRASDVSTLDQLREQAASLGFAAELTSVTPGSGGIEGKLRLREGRA